MRCLLVFAIAFLGAAPAPASSVRPNVILFLVDDLGWQDTAVPLHVRPTHFNVRYRTPNQMALAARGMRFTNAYASAPVCTPTRTSIMTGLSPARSRITYWTLHRDRDTSRARGDLAAPAWRLNGLGADDLTLPGLLRDAGYRTIHAGKAHFGAHDTSGADPVNLGFDVNIAGHASGGPASFYGRHHFTVAGRQGKDPSSSSSVWDIPGLEAYHGKDIYLTEALAIEAQRAIRDAVSDGTPFYLNFAPYAVHAPIMANERYLETYDGLHPAEAAYATMVETVDAALGALVSTLEELGIADETVIIFHSDNGGLSAHARGGARHTHNAPLRSGKGSAYEGGTRVPLIVTWPGHVPAATSCDVPVVSHDLFPTILALAGVEIPAEHASHVDGRDLEPLLEERAETSARVIGWHQPHQWGASGPGIEPFTSIRDGDWKLIYFHAGSRFELYDLGRDVGERHDLAAARPDRVRALAAVMDEWIIDRAAQLSIDTTTSRPIAMPGEAAAALEMPVTTIPIASTEDRAAAAGWLGGGTWMDQHEDAARAVTEHGSDVVLIGDSITQSWGGPGRNVGAPGGSAFERAFAGLRVANAGISGDRTQHVLWRIDHGLLDAMPRVVVLMIGTNNLPHDEGPAIAAGIESIVSRVLARDPSVQVLIVGVPPRDAQPNSARRARAIAANATVASLAQHPRVTFVDPAPVLLGADGRPRPGVMRGDAVHLTPAGYEALAAVLRPRIDRLLTSP